MEEGALGADVVRDAGRGDPVLGALGPKTRESRPTHVVVRMTHSLAAHRNPPPQPLEGDASAELPHESLPVELVPTVADYALHLDDRERRVTTRSEIHEQGAHDDKNIFIGGVRPRVTATILIPLPESSIQLMLGLDSCPGGTLDAADNTEHTKNINRSSDMKS